MDHYFSGSATGAIDRYGRVALPAFVKSVLARTAPDSGSLLLGRHEADACAVGYDRARIPQLAADLERQRLRDEALGTAPAAHHARCRRLFGLAREAAFDGRGRILLPERERSRLGVVRDVLFVGTGSTFEIWALERACHADAGMVAEIARFHLSDEGLCAAA